ncbi:MAG TPA: hypothetical protein VH540_10235 [Ktedonobacterales bacterium]|jgi:hypothetical protein
MAEQQSSGNQQVTQEELVRRLLTQPMLAGEQEAQLLPGRLPDGLPLEFPLPEGSRVIGSVARIPAVAEIVLDVPLAPEQVLTFYRERLSALGWQPPEDQAGHRPSGFAPSNFRMPHHASFARNDGPGSLHFTVWTGKSGIADVRVHLDMNAPPAPNARQRHMRRQHHGFHDLLPWIEAPAGARQMGGGGSGGEDSYFTQATLETDSDLSSLAAHYAVQLEKAGWTRTGEGQSGPLAWHTWTLQDEDQEPWEGLFSIIKTPGKERRHMLYLYIEWANKPEPGFSSGGFSYTRLS